MMKKKMMRIEFLYSKLMNSIVFFSLFCFFHLWHACAICCYLLTKNPKKIGSVWYSFPSCHIKFVKKLNGFHQMVTDSNVFMHHLLPLRVWTCAFCRHHSIIAVNTQGFNRLFLVATKDKKKSASRAEHRLWFDR